MMIFASGVADVKILIISLENVTNLNRFGSLLILPSSTDQVIPTSLNGSIII